MCRCHSIAVNLMIITTGFSNSTIWPMFHYFNNAAQFNEHLFAAYRVVNRKFAEVVGEYVEEGDVVWAHDYQLLLLPRMLREQHDDVSIGFFLHIPFPSYELFRLIPWREELLNGMLGADLIGFHTYDYVRHFQSSVRRLLRLDCNGNQLYVGNRPVQSDVFPMGIDYRRFSTALSQKSIREETSEIFERTKGMQVILSVDRLDYTKGIPGRIKAYAYFLRSNPQYRERVAMILIVAPSRVRVGSYQDLLREIEELTGHTNGEFGTIGWTPVWFFYRSFQFASLTALYGRADVMLVTPLRDGMNLVAKEYIATRSDRQGMLVISETAGAASELSEAILVNATDIPQVAAGLRQALETPKVEQIERNTVLHERLERYNIEFWAQDYMQKLAAVVKNQQSYKAQTLSEDMKRQMATAYRNAAQRLLFLDYDGTLVQFYERLEDAMPDQSLLDILMRLRNEGTEVVIISGRDKDTLEKWLGDKPIGLIAAHGLWYKPLDGAWTLSHRLNDDWKRDILPVLRLHSDRTPGAFVEDKSYSLAWHYRRCDPDLAQVRLGELRETLRDMTQDIGVSILEGNKVLELKDSTVNKGVGVLNWLNERTPDFLLCAGDDWTDEDMFQVLSAEAVTIKVGLGVSKARYRLQSPDKMRALLQTFTIA